MLRPLRPTRHIVGELVERKQSFIAQTRRRCLQRRHRTIQKMERRMPVRLFERRATEPLGGALVDPRQDGQMFAGRSGYRCIAIVESDDEDRGASVAAPVLPCGLHIAGIRFRLGSISNDFERELPWPDEETSPAPAATIGDRPANEIFQEHTTPVALPTQSPSSGVLPVYPGVSKRGRSTGIMRIRVNLCATSVQPRPHIDHLNHSENRRVE